MESALGDYAVARDLHCHNKLNWASTAYYYSIVHALRLMCFIAKGDFPEGHSELARLYKDGKCDNKKTWLCNFASVDRTSFSREQIEEYFRQSSSLSDILLREWGEILDTARECRNDSNYEGLIIAHEYKHSHVTVDFNRLADVLRGACERALPKVIFLFKNFIDAQPRKGYWYAYLNWEAERKGLYHFEDSLKFRLLGRSNLGGTNNSNQNVNPVFDIQSGNVIVNNILEWINPFRINGFNASHAGEVWNNIEFGIFNEKADLMQHFRGKIDSLCQRVAHFENVNLPQ